MKDHSTHEPRVAVIDSKDIDITKGLRAEDYVPKFDPGEGKADKHVAAKYMLGDEERDVLQHIAELRSDLDRITDDIVSGANKRGYSSELERMRHQAEEYDCLMQCFADLGVPDAPFATTDTYSLWGKVQVFAELCVAKGYVPKNPSNKDKARAWIHTKLQDHIGVEELQQFLNTRRTE